jgi:hypothetical protein
MRRKTNVMPHYAVCVNNEGYKASLEIGKLYGVIPDEQAALHGYIRVIDESGEDYGYSAKRFFPIKIPRELEKALFNGIHTALDLPTDKLMRRTREKSKPHATHRK